MHFVGDGLAAVRDDRSDLRERSFKDNGFFTPIITVIDLCAGVLLAEGGNHQQTDLAENGFCHGNNVFQLEILEFEGDVLAGLLDTGVQEFHTGDLQLLHGVHAGVVHGGFLSFLGRHDKYLLFF